MLSDTIQIRCTRCKSAFRDRAKRVQPGYSRPCPSCEAIIFFEETANDLNVQTALRAARRLRRELREQEGVKPEPKPATVYDRTST